MEITSKLLLLLRILMFNIIFLQISITVLEQNTKLILKKKTEIDRERNNKKYRCDDTYNRRKIQAQKDKYNLNEAFRSRTLQTQKLKYASGPLFADRKKRSTKKLYYSNIVCRRKKQLQSATK